MKPNQKRLLVYSFLALPILCLAGYLMTLDPIGRENFFAEFKSNTLRQFGAEDENADLVAPADQQDDQEESQEGERGRRGNGGGQRSFDPAQFFADRDTDGASMRFDASFTMYQ